MTATTTRTPSWERRAAAKRARTAALAAEDPRFIDPPTDVRAAGFRAMTAAAETTVDLGQIYARTLAALWPLAVAAAEQHIDAAEQGDELAADIEMAVEQLVEADTAPDMHMLFTPKPVAVDDCVFCAIVAGTAHAELVEVWPDAVAIVPLNPVVDGHVLVIPRVHVPHALADADVSAVTMRRAAQLAESMGLEHANIITSRGTWATQTVEHLHLHIVPRRQGDGLPLPWTPQQAAARAASIDPAARFVVSSFGFLHGPPPTADIVVDLRPRLRDPHTDPALRQLTGLDDAIGDKVRATSGYRDVVVDLIHLAVGLADAGERPVHIALGCAGGRHRSVVAAIDLGVALSEVDSRVQVRHIDIHEPVVERGGAR